jgi:omega-amidase
MRDLKIMCLQSDLVWNDPEKNKELFEIMINNHADKHDLIILPETFTTGFPDFPQFTSEEMNGKSMKWMAKIAEKTNAVVTGSLILSHNGKNTNTLVWMKPDGQFSTYDKRHVFSMAGEHEVIVKGTEQLIVELKGWKIKPMICYDLRFPVWSKNKFDENNNYEYDLAIYVANWPAIRNYPWTQLLLARAIENLVYVVGVNRIGYDKTGKLYIGNSMVIDPKGKIISDAGESRERILTEILSYSELIEFRKKFNAGPDWDNFSIQI